MYSSIVIDQFDSQFDFYSDFYKSVNGFRPRHDFGFDVDLWASVFAELRVQSARVDQEAEQAEDRQVAMFEAIVASIIESGAGDRETAIRWYAQGEDFQCDQDVEFWLYKQGLLHTSVHAELLYRLRNGWAI